MATIKDVAREAGVSLGTVSAVLNHQASVKQVNVDKVHKAIEKLDYKVNMVARALKTGSSTNIGLIIPDINNPYYPEFARGVEDAAKEYDMTVFLCNADRKAEKEIEYINALLTQKVVAIIVVKPTATYQQLAHYCDACNFIFVDADSQMTQKYDCLCADSVGGVTQMTQMFIDRGHQCIAYISGKMDSVWTYDRAQAYRDVLEHNQIPYRTEYFIEGTYDWNNGYDSTMQLLELPERPDAIFAANDVIAFGVLKALHEKNIKIPEDISVCGFDDIAQASYSWPPLTTVKMPKYEMGFASVQMLKQKLNGELMPSMQHTVQVFSTEIIERDTVRDRTIGEHNE